MDGIASSNISQLNERFPNVGKASTKLLYQTCRMENINKYADEEEFFKNENLIDFVIGIDSMYEDLEKYLKEVLKR